MDVKCQVCESKGRVADEVQNRAVLWICGGCETRYLVSASGMRKAPAPPPQRRRVQHTTDESQVLFSAEQVKALRSLAPRAPKGTPAAVPALASAVAPTLAPAAPALEPPATPLPSLPPVHSLYSVTAIPVRDPFWRRPALLGGALAGLLVGLAAWGVGWGREHVLKHPPSITAAIAAPEPAVPPRVVPAPNPIAPNAIAPTPPAANAPETTSAPRDAAPAEPNAKRSARALREVARANAGVTSRGAKSATASAEPTELAAEEPPAVEASPAPEATAAAPAPLAPAAAPPLADAIAAAAAKGAPVAPLAEAPASQTSESAATPFSRDAALAALGGAASAAARCRSNEGPFGSARVAVTFSPAGMVTTANVEGAPFAGTPVGSCIARAFRSARVSPFSGGSVTVHKSVTIF